MRKKSRIKSIFLTILVMIMFLSPVLLAGCTGNTGTNSGGTGSGDSGGTGGSGSGDGGDSGNTGDGGGTGGNTSGEEKIEDYFDNYRIAYQPSSEEKVKFFVDVQSQASEVAFSILANLFAEYGTDVYAYKDEYDYKGDYSYPSISVDKDGNYVSELKALSTIEICNTKSPLFSKTIDVFDENVTYTYNADASYAKFWTHTNAMTADVTDYDYQKSYDGVKTRWNWLNDDGLLEAVNKEDYSDSEIADYKRESCRQMQSYFYNLNINAKIQLAIFMITSGYNISETGANRNEFETDCEKIDNLFFNNNESINFSYKINTYKNTEKANAFFKTVKTEIYNKYLLQIDHGGFAKSEISAIQDFVKNDVVGKELVEKDQQRFYNVSASESNIYSVLSNDLMKKYPNFLTEETLLSTNLKSNDVDFGVILSRPDDIYFKYEDATEYNSASADQKQISSILSKLQQTFILCSKQQDNTEHFSNITQNVLAGFIDTNNDGKFESDVNNYESTDTTKSIINNGSALFSVRKAYFKNYVVTINKIVENIANEAPSKEFKENFAKTYGFEYPYETIYPVIPLSYFADCNNEDMLFNNTGDICHMFTGYQNYQDIILMPKNKVSLEEIALFVIREKSDIDFDLHMYARYYDALTNSFATWGEGENESEFYDIGLHTITYKDYGEDNLVPGASFPIDTKTILSTAKINGQKKGNSILDPFTDLFSNQQTQTSQIVSKRTIYGKFYKYDVLPNGDKVITFTEENMKDNEQRVSYFEVLFSSDSLNKFQFCFYPAIFKGVK